MKILVTGAAGFIGFHLSKKLLAQGHTVVGVDNLNDYYDPALKKARLAQLEVQANFIFDQLDISDRDKVAKLFANGGFSHVVNLAAQAGVRYSLQNPHAYVDSNLVGFVNILEGCRHSKIEHFVYASSSSVYGLNSDLPFSTHHEVGHQVSLYGASKRSNELLAHSYSHLYNLPTTGLRFFTVYGPWGRPDMALYIFTKAILAGESIPVFNEGKMHRDFTYIDDIVEGTARLLFHPAAPNQAWDSKNPDPASSSAPYAIYNIGNNNTVELKHFIEVLESALGKKAKLNLLPMQAGDVVATFARIDELQGTVGFSPSTSLEVGVKNFVDWYKEYHRI